MALSVGVVGVGVHGNHHIRLLSQMDEAELAGFYDASPEVRKSIAAEYKNAVAFDSLDALLDEVDAVSVAVPTTAHHETVLACLDAGVHVLVEKPIAVTLDEADEMIARAEEKSCILSVGQLERFNPAYRSVMLSDTPPPVFIETHRLSVFNPRGTDVAVVLDLMIHDIDIVLDMVRRPVETVRAVGVSVVSDEVDIANARIEFEGGAVANLTASRISTKKMRKIRTFGPNSYISMDCLAGESEIFTMDSDKRPEATPGALPQLMDGITYKKHPNDGANALELEIKDFLDAVKTGVKPTVTGDDGRRNLEVALDVMHSMKQAERKLKS